MNSPQDTFVRVMKARHDVPIREPRGYLSAIARSLLISTDTLLDELGLRQPCVAL
ncbi:hypothetical protein [Pseudomonas helleri]|uniref:hypothetical protein n=1 Tax=Pseudomonas helleri TaxID=1608996 RepID=UPI003DA7A1FE